MGSIFYILYPSDVAMFNTLTIVAIIVSVLLALLVGVGIPLFLIKKEGIKKMNYDHLTDDGKFVLSLPELANNFKSVNKIKYKLEIVVKDEVRKIDFVYAYRVGNKYKHNRIVADTSEGASIIVPISSNASDVAISVNSVNDTPLGKAPSCSLSNKMMWVISAVVGGCALLPIIFVLVINFMKLSPSDFSKSNFAVQFLWLVIPLALVPATYFLLKAFVTKVGKRGK